MLMNKYLYTPTYIRTTLYFIFSINFNINLKQNLPSDLKLQYTIYSS